MSTLWTPSGEHRPSEPPPATPPAAPPAGAAPGAPPGAPPGTDQVPTAEELAAMREVHARLTATPAEDMIANHVIGLWELALVYLGVATPPDEQGRRPYPNLAAAGLVIDAVAAIVDGLGTRLGEHEHTLRDALHQAQMVYVQLADALSGEHPEPSS